MANLWDNSRAMLWAVAVFAALPATAQTVPQPPGYHGEPYRSPVPAELSGALVIDAEAAYALWHSGRVAFIDVLPRAPKPEGLPAGTIWRDKPRVSIPGAIWLPNVGYEALAPSTDQYFRAGVAQATAGDLAAPVVFFCLDECWMSWNAAKRAMVDYGLTRVFWFPGGTDEWEFQGYPTQAVLPAAPPP